MSTQKFHTFYHACGYSQVPEEVRVIRFTDASVWLETGQRRPREGYFLTLKEAVEYQRELAHRSIVSIDRQMKQLQENRDFSTRMLDRLNAELESGEFYFLPRLKPLKASDIMV